MPRTCQPNYGMYTPRDAFFSSSSPDILHRLKVQAGIERVRESRQRELERGVLQSPQHEEENCGAVIYDTSSPRWISDCEAVFDDVVCGALYRYKY